MQTRVRESTREKSIPNLPQNMAHEEDRRVLCTMYISHHRRGNEVVYNTVEETLENLSTSQGIYCSTGSSLRSGASSDEYRAMARLYLYRGRYTAFLGSQLVTLLQIRPARVRLPTRAAMKPVTLCSVHSHASISFLLKEESSNWGQIFFVPC